VSEHFDALETRDPEQRETALLAALAAQVANARANAPAGAERFAGPAATVNSRAALAALPVLHKSELLERQRATLASDAFGGFAAIGWGARRPPARRATHVFVSPGPIHEPESARPDYWRMGRALFAAGFRPGDLVHNSFSYHFTPAGAMMDSGAVAIGCTVFPAGTGQTELQLQAMADLRPDAYVGTPSFLRILLEKADETGVALPSLKKASLGGEAFPAALRDWLAARGIAGYQSYGTADLGLVAYETEAREGLVVDEGVIVEIVRPGTGDLSAVLPGRCPTGRTNQRIRGWMGRADQSAKVRGMFVHPPQVAEIARRHPEVKKARLVVSGERADDRMSLEVEVEGVAPEGLAERIAGTIREVTKLRGEVTIRAPGRLPNDGKVIEDRRKYD
jgi:phenylacetate-CoA ligase